MIAGDAPRRCPLCHGDKVRLVPQVKWANAQQTEEAMRLGMRPTPSKVIVSTPCQVCDGVGHVPD